MNELAIFGAVFVGSVFGVGVVTSLVRRRGMLDTPNERSSHTVPTPRGGGIAIVIMSTVALCVLQIARPFCTPLQFAILIGGSLTIAAISWIDDMKSVPARVRLLVHLAVATMTAVACRGWSDVWLPGAGVVHMGMFGSCLAILWITGLTNAYNFMDGIDGITGLQAVIAGLGWVALSRFDTLPVGGTTGLVVAAAAAGFLVHNWQPARIFMGDVGSAYLGYVFATIAVFDAESSPRAGIAGVLLVWPFIFDTALTLARRARKGERLWEAHRTHLYQRLQQSGWSHARVSLLYGLLALLGVGAALSAVSNTLIVSLIAVPGFATLLFFFVRSRERA